MKKGVTRPLLEIHNQARPGMPVAWLRGTLEKLLTQLNIRAGNWSLTLVGDEAMAALHQRTMNLASTTDVLTFDLRETLHGAAAIDLDTVICVDEAARQAAQRGHPLRHELLLYAIHSLLHVRGYDDVSAPKARRMHRREDALLVALGIGPVYARPAGEAGVLRGGRAASPAGRARRNATARR